MALLASREIRTILRHEQIAQRRAARVSEAPILYEPPKRLALSVDERGGCERKQVEERLDRQSIIEQIAGLPCFNAEQDLILYDFGS